MCGCIYLFRIHVIQMILDELHRGLEVSLVELVGNVPAERPVLPPLQHHRVQEGCRVKQPRPLRDVRVVQKVLRRCGS